MEWIIQNAAYIVDAVTKLIAAAAAIAALTPNPKDDSAVRWVRQIIDTLALNFGNARNEKK
jgi:hypothetical protein